MRALWKWAAAAAGLAAAATWLLLEWQPRRQVEKRAARLLEAAAARDWKRVEGFLDPSYRDAWNASREEALESARMLGGHFFTLQIQPRRPPVIHVEGGSARWSAPLEFTGRGTAIGGSLLDEAAALSAPFVLYWHRGGPHPACWKLVSAAQPEIPSLLPP